MVWPQNPVATATHLKTRRQKRTHIQKTIDSNRFNWLVWAVASSGFFTDSYNLFSTNVILPSLAYVYWQDDHDGYHESTINTLTLGGSILGQLLFGYLADRYGRTKLYGFELIIVIFSTIGVTQSSSGWNGSMSITALLYSWRFLMGIGIGAEYPLSAVITAEWAPVKSRARMMAAVFLMQPVGQLMAQLVGLWVLWGLNRSRNFEQSRDSEYCKPIVDSIWRWVSGVGAIPALVAIIFRWTITDPGRFTLDVQDDGDRAVKETAVHYGVTDPLIFQSDLEMDEIDPDMDGFDEEEEDEPLPVPFSWVDIKQYFITEGNWRYLAGTSACWFLMDFAFYGLGINNPHALARLWASQPAHQNVTDVPHWVSDITSVKVEVKEDGDLRQIYPPIYQVLENNGKQSILTASLGSIVGSLVLIKMINYIPRKKVLSWSCLWLAALLAITGGSYFRAFHTDFHAVSIVLYALCQLSFNFGPNTLTFIIPAEIFPTRYRGTCHGIAAAAGKLGSVVVQSILPHVAFGGVSINAPNSNGLGWVLIIFSFVMASSTLFAWAWIPDLQDPRKEEGGPEMPSKTLEELAEGKKRAEAEGQIIGIRAKLRRIWFLWRTE